MSVIISQTAFRGWANALRVGNGTVELVATLDVGPRILSYSRVGGVSPFHIYDDHAGGTGEPQWRNRGGHRLWLAPEGPEFSYFPDNHPVAWEKLGTTGVRLTPPPESATGFQKQIDLILAEKGSQVTVVHRLRRIGPGPACAAPWALTVMAPGGRAIIPQPPFGQHPRDMLPNRRMILWPYTDLSDPRYRFGRRFLTLRQDPAGAATKIGLALSAGWAGYLLNRTLFIKRFPWNPAAAYPDGGCNFETFTNAKMLEVESLGPLLTLEPGQVTELVEQWEIHDGLPAVDPDDEDGLQNLLAACVT